MELRISRNELLPTLFWSALIPIVCYTLVGILLISTKHAVYEHSIEAYSSHLKREIQLGRSVPASIYDLHRASAATPLVSPFDPDGQLLFFQALSEKHYLLARFDPDAKRYRMIDHSLPKLPERPVPFAAKMAPAAIGGLTAEGASSNDGEYLAKIFVRRQSGERHLLVRSYKSEDFFYLAPSLSVEEFIWKPDSHEIYLSSVGDIKWRDSLYRVGMKDFQMVDLLPGDPIKGTVSRRYLALAGIDETSKALIAFSAENHNPGLDPRTFFAPHSCIQVDDAFFRQGCELQPLPHPNAHISFPKAMWSAQRDWRKLPMNGSVDKVIDAWQIYTEKYHEASTLPYALYWLTAIYDDAVQVTTVRGLPKESDILQAYGNEIATALSIQYWAPSYLRAIGQWYKVRSVEPLDTHQPKAVLHIP